MDGRKERKKDREGKGGRKGKLTVMVPFVFLSLKRREQNSIFHMSQSLFLPFLR